MSAFKSSTSILSRHLAAMQSLDYPDFFAYFIAVSTYGYWNYRRKIATKATSADFFPAEGSFTWWAIGASNIASNISAEQFIGTSGSVLVMGVFAALFTIFW
jgi:SSS family solute:Na+ symporter